MTEENYGSALRDNCDQKEETRALFRAVFFVARQFLLCFIVLVGICKCLGAKLSSGFGFFADRTFF
jgi:hypothetical protein